MIGGHQFTAVLIGIASHVLYFNKGEHHLYGSLYVQALILTFASSTGLIYFQNEEADLKSSAKEPTKLILSFLTGLYSSLIIYRLFLSPLNKFPGSISARISSFWLSYQFRHRDAYKQIKALHDKHGLFVRIGPSDLIIAHPKAVNVIYGAGSKCTKAANYDLTRPVVSLQTFRDKAEHDARRRVWSAAFGDKALRGYEQRIRNSQDKLVAHLAGSEGKPVNMTEMFGFYGFDVMGDLAFGKSFDMIEASKAHWAIELLYEGLKPLAFNFPIWFFRVLTSLPLVTRDWWRLINFCQESILLRMEIKEQNIPDISSVLVAPFKGKPPTKEELNLLTGDSQLIIAAGSDTTATTLTATIYLLAKHPAEVQKLRSELAPYISNPSGKVLNEEIAKLGHLNGIINEAMRLYPAVPDAISRQTPPEGIDIEGTYVPGNMNVGCSQYALGRSEAAFSRPDEFLPERWYKYPEMVKEPTAYAPFSTGPYGCIGKPLALLNLRTTITRLVTSFDFGFPPGDDGASFERDTIDQFLLCPGDVNLVFTRRDL
ncbi:putative cytochrome P450 [Bisporella sp. PMI_857]|nr:putative cytochrome P450 [Bisporella sp. PMI_857]